MNIGTASVMIVALLLGGIAFIYYRCHHLSRSLAYQRKTVQAERLKELVGLTSHPTKQLENI